ncbi:MAG: vitamin B12 dependent-methionine synthase activation domain-containing protein [Monoglobales bacterium]
MENIVFVKNYDAPIINIKEILRYLGVKECTPDFKEIIDSCIKETEEKLIYKVCYSILPVKVQEDYIDFGLSKVESNNLKRNLEGMGRAVIFAATIGIGFDRLIAKYSALSPSKALIFQAIGAERVESLCDAFNEEIVQEFIYTKPRFSPGYGDLPLEFQKDIFSLINPTKHIGIFLNDSLMMSPSKSVTAIIGIGDKK